MYRITIQSFDASPVVIEGTHAEVKKQLLSYFGIATLPEPWADQQQTVASSPTPVAARQTAAKTAEVASRLWNQKPALSALYIAGILRIAPGTLKKYIYLDRKYNSAKLFPHRRPQMIEQGRLRVASWNKKG